MLSWKECLQVWCETQGLMYGGFDEVSIEDFVRKSKMGPDLGLEFAEMFAFMDSPGYNGTEPSVILPTNVCLFLFPFGMSLKLTRSQLTVACPLTSFENWCRSTDFSDLISRNSIHSD